MHNAVVCTLSLYDVIGITRHLHVKLKSFSNIAQPLHKEAVRRCSFSFIIAKKSVIMIDAFLVDVSICTVILPVYKQQFLYHTQPLKKGKFAAFETNSFCHACAKKDRKYNRIPVFANFSSVYT